jgi:hypothetical protein
VSRHPFPRACTALIALASLCVGGARSAEAAPATVSLRIEGSNATYFEGPIATDARVLNGGDGTGPHLCDGDDSANPRPTPTTALADAAVAAGFGWRGNWDPSFDDFFIDAIAGEASKPPTAYWSILDNGRYTAGGCTSVVRQGDDVLFAWDTLSRPMILDLVGPSHADVGQAITVQVRTWLEDDSGRRFAPVAGASVGGETTDAAGMARLLFTMPGRQLLKATHYDAVRSNALSVCVGDGLCAGPAVDCSTSPAPAQCKPPTLQKSRAPALTVRVNGRRVLRRRYVTIRVRSDQEATAFVSGHARMGAHTRRALGRARIELVPGQQKLVKLRAPRRTRRSALRAFRKGRLVKVTVRVEARNGAGNTARVRASSRLRRKGRPARNRAPG